VTLVSCFNSRAYAHRSPNGLLYDSTPTPYPSKRLHRAFVSYF